MIVREIYSRHADRMDPRGDRCLGVSVSCLLSEYDSRDWRNSGSGLPAALFCFQSVKWLTSGIGVKKIPPPEIMRGGGGKEWLLLPHSDTYFDGMGRESVEFFYPPVNPPADGRSKTGLLLSFTMIGASFMQNVHLMRPLAAPPLKITAVFLNDIH